MSRIKSISLSQLSTDELHWFSKSTLEKVEPLLLSHPFISRQVSKIRTALQLVDEVTGTPQGSTTTTRINKTDDEVDSLLYICKENLTANAKLRDVLPARARSSEALLSYFKNSSKDLYTGGYDSQARQIDTLFSNIFSEKHTDDRKQCGINTVLETLKERYHQLKSLLNERSNEASAPTTLKEQKVVLRYRLEKLLSHIDVNCLDNIEGYESVHDPLNEVITEVMARYRSRTTRTGNRNN